MDKALTFNRLVKQTCYKILKQFIISLFLFYFLPMVFTAFDNITEKNASAFAIYFNTVSWIYISIIFFSIIAKNIRSLLEKIKLEMDIVYNQSLLIDNDNQPSSELTIVELITTEQKIQEMQSTIKKMILAEKQQKQELMFQVSAAAHDLKTPLTVIQGNSQYLQSVNIDGKSRQCLVDIESASLQLNRYFNQLINYSKTFYNDSSEWDRVSSDYLIELLEQEVNLIIGQKAQVSFSNHLTSSIELTINLNLFLRAVINVITNAMHYSKSNNPSICIDYSIRENNFRISIWNSDSSFSNDVLQKHGIMFYKENSSCHALQNNNYGIGIAFIKRVAQIHNGSLRLSNFNNGALVEIDLSI